MRIRSLTYFLNHGWPLDEAALGRASEFAAAATRALVDAGYEVQTARLACPPFSHLLPGGSPADLARLAQALEAAAALAGFSYVSLGPALPERLETYTWIPAALAATQNAFFSGALTGADGAISLPAVRASAQVIQQAAGISPDGFANLRFAALANVPAGSPFFPAAYHTGGEERFAIATEAADLAVNAFSWAASLAEARRRLVEAMEQHAQVICGAVAGLAGPRFGGIDYSLAPFPDEAVSLGTAMERLGVSALGLHGSLAAAAILAETMDRASFPRAGFSGLMLPVLEDATLARRAA